MSSGDGVDTAGMSVISKMTRVLDQLARSRVSTAAGLAVELDDPIASVYRMLGHLENIGWVEKGPTRGQYHLGVDLVGVAQAIEASLDVRQFATPVLAELNAQTHESTYLCVRNDLRAVCIERYDGAHIQASEFPVGGSLPLHRGASSRAILAFEPAEFRRDYVSTLTRADANPFTQADALALDQDLGEVEVAGVAISDGDVTPGTLTVAAPIFSHRGDVLGSISVSGLKSRAESHRLDFTSLVTAGARRISAGLGYPVPEES